MGGETEDGIWIWFREALEGKKEYKVDNLFLYSDQQAGHGGLYGLDPSDYSEFVWESTTNSWDNVKYIDVMKLINKYREKINAKLNVFSIQIAGYDNSLLPENIYRGSVKSSWTGSELKYAK